LLHHANKTAKNKNVAVTFSAHCHNVIVLLNKITFFVVFPYDSYFVSAYILPHVV